MEKGYREVKCPWSVIQRCRFKIRLTVTVNDYGKTVSVTCPKCETKFRTTIPTPTVAEEKVDTQTTDDFMDGLNELFGNFKK